MAAKALVIGTTGTVSSSASYEFRMDNLLPRHSNVTFFPESDPACSLAEAFNILLPDEESKLAYREEKTRMDQELLLRIHQGKVNPIRGWRIVKGMDQKTLVERTGIGQSNLARMERLGVHPSPENLKKIAEALDIDIKELLK
jgi:DNA-binding Xre family transcriptional regulator